MAIILVSFWLVAWLGGGRNWPLRAGARQIVSFTLMGLVTTVVLEILSTHVWRRLTYAESMPLIPILDVGMAPFLPSMGLAASLNGLVRAPPDITKRPKFRMIFL